MLINLRNALMAGKRLPYDAEVEYLKSTGTQWINTLVYPDLSSAKIEIQAVKATGYTLFGANSYMRCTGNGGYNINYAYYNQLQFANYTPTDISSPHVFILDKNEFYVDGELKGTATISSRVSSFPICLYGYSTNTQGTATSDRGVHTIYYCKIYNNGTLVRDYIPVRKGTVGYLYDRVSGKLFGNAGTGDFVLGPDVVPVEYIESHGAEWIDTGLLGRDGYDFEYRFRPMRPLPCGIGGEYESQKNCYIGIIRSNGNLAYNYYYNNIVEVQSLTLDTDYDIKAHLYSGEQYFEVNGVRGEVGNRTGAFTSSYNLYLFAINSANQPTNFGVMRLYNLSARLNTIPTRSLRPVRVGTEGAMMDTLTRRIYRNAGTGVFTYGNDLKYPIPAS